jgi:hypothetical protein
MGARREEVIPIRKYSSHSVVTAAALAVTSLSALILFMSVSGRVANAAKGTAIAATEVSKPYVSGTPDTHTEKSTGQSAPESESATRKSEESAKKTEKSYIQYYTKQDAFDIARVLYTECRGVASMTEQACVAWVILNRADYDGSTIYAVVRAKNQFAFSEHTRIDGALLQLAYDVLGRWDREKNGESGVGRVLPTEYRFFEGKGGHNYFKDRYDGSYTVWNYTLNSPYKS